MTYTCADVLSSVMFNSLMRNCLSNGVSGWPDSVDKCKLVTRLICDLSQQNRALVAFERNCDIPFNWKSVSSAQRWYHSCVNWMQHCNFMVKNRSEFFFIFFVFFSHIKQIISWILPFPNTSAPARLRLPVPHVWTKPLKSSLSLHAKILLYIWNEWIKYCKRYHYEVNRSVLHVNC